MKRRIKWFRIVLALIILTGIILGIILLNNGDKKDKDNKKDIKEEIVKNIEYKESITINIGDNIPTINEYKTNDVEVDNDIVWNTDKDNINYYPGTYEGKFNYNNKEYTVKLNVRDINPPIINNVKDITIYEKEEYNLLKDIKVTDDSYDKVDISIKGDYNLDKSGTYNLAYEAIDSSGNSSHSKFKLIVKKKEVVNNNTSTRVDKTGTTSKGYEIKKIDGIYYINGILIANKSYDLPSNYAPGGLLNEFNIAFTKMKEDAAKEGINLKIVSGYRSYDRQKTIYNNYVARDGKSEADTYSARPGHSEHQTGLAADINLVDTSFANTKEGKWLANNCYKYGFILRYPKGKESITGYIYEPWHFRFIGDEAKNLYNDGNWISLEEYLGIDSKY